MILTYAELFQLCLVIIEVIRLVLDIIQIIQSKKKTK
jgi:hypothetical protein